MRIRTIRRMAKLLLCAFACIVIAMLGTDSAMAMADNGGDAVSNITIRITPPSGWATQRAEVEIRITDNTGAGFQSAQVKAGGKSWEDITGRLEQTENRHYCVVEITENCTVSVHVTGWDGRTYEKSEYIRCFDTASDERDTTASGQGSSGTASTPATPPGSSATATVPSGQGTVIDNATNEDGREFFTITTQDENYFYLIIDRQRDSENVYFLDTVKESDLLSLAEKDQGQDTPGVSAIPDPEPVCICTDKCVPGEVNTACEVCVLSLKDCTGKAPAVVPDDPEPVTQEKGGSGTLIIVVIAALAAGGVGYYLKIYKPKKDLDDAEDFDELTGEAEETVNEDGEDPAPNHDPYGEPEEPDYPEGYGYEEPEDEA